MRFTRYFWVLLGLLVAAGCLFGLFWKMDAPRGQQRLVVRYWEKWNGFEADAMRSVVDDFNQSQDRIFVEYSSVGDIDRKLMLATAGGIPPDVAGLWSHSLSVYVENNALTPLDKLAAQAGIGRDRYIRIFWDMCHYRDHLWSLPSTPASLGLVWNKTAFRNAGLDPEYPPQSIAELEEINARLTKWAPDGSLQSMGHLPQEPGWYSPFWGMWFGGRLWDGEGHITANSPENLAAYQWCESYPKRYGANKLLAFRDSFGNFASAQNPFFTGRLAMVLQGPWIYNFIRNYAPPGFDWGVTAFPSVDPVRLKNVALVDCDMLVIPRGATHPEAAFEFIQYVNSQKPMEKLCMGQLKFSPLRTCSPDFYKRNPNPHAADFAALAQSPNAQHAPYMATWNEYEDDMSNAFNQICIGDATAEQALQSVQEHQQSLLDRRIARWNRISPELLGEWSHQ